MADEQTPRWLPPEAPGGAAPPRFEPAPPPGPEAPPPASAPATVVPSDGGSRAPTFVRGGGQSNTLAITALVLAIAGLGLLLVTFGLAFIIALPCSIAAWICGAQARTRINLGESDSGRAQAQAAYILGVIGVVLGVIAAIGWIAAVAAGVDLEQLRRDIERQSNPDARKAAIGAVRALLAR
jgi:hypothetical protein